MQCTRHLGSPDVSRYDPIARVLHWIFAVAIVYTSVVGYALSHISDSPLHDFMSRLNMSIATVLIGLFPLRVGWKLIRKEPSPINDVAPWQQSLAAIVHTAIYLAIFVVLVTGFLAVPNSYSFFGIAEIRTPFAKGPLTESLFDVHRISCAVLAGLVVLHVSAVIKHQLFESRDVLRRIV